MARTHSIVISVVEVGIHPKCSNRVIRKLVLNGRANGDLARGKLTYLTNKSARKAMDRNMELGELLG